MGRTFEELGIPFPLYEGLVEQTFGYFGVERCSLCGRKGQHCFELGIGGRVIVPCHHCRTMNGLDTDEKRGQPCSKCGRKVPFPYLAYFDRDTILTCYDCLRAGKAAITKDTELGMIRWEDAVEGVTHGRPKLNRGDFEMVPRHGDWIGARLEREAMFELVRTPRYFTWQGEEWQFCCQWPMVYLGEWTETDFCEAASDGNGERLFGEVVKRQIPGLWEDTVGGAAAVYMFRCAACGGLRGHWDRD